jgi:hypothetical protein
MVTQTRTRRPLRPAGLRKDFSETAEGTLLIVLYCKFPLCKKRIALMAGMIGDDRENYLDIWGELPTIKDCCQKSLAQAYSVMQLFGVRRNIRTDAPPTVKHAPEEAPFNPFQENRN